jgi:hypothetical protein
MDNFYTNDWDKSVNLRQFYPLTFLPNLEETVITRLQCQNTMTCLAERHVTRWYRIGTTFK